MDKKILLENSAVGGTQKKSFYSGFEKCTFTPQLNSKSVSLAQKRRRDANKDGTIKTGTTETENPNLMSAVVVTSEILTGVASTSVPKKIRDFDPEAYKAE